MHVQRRERTRGERMTTIAIRRNTIGDGVLRLDVVGEVDVGTCDLLTATIRDAVTSGDTLEVLVDLAHVTYMDSTGIAAVAGGFELASKHGVAYRVNPAPSNESQVWRRGR
jgi:anti-anti-sigma factor